MKVWIDVCKALRERTEAGWRSEKESEREREGWGWRMNQMEVMSRLNGDLMC